VSDKGDLLVESARARLAYAYDRQFAVSLSGIRTLPHQIEAVYLKMIGSAMTVVFAQAVALTGKEAFGKSRKRSWDRAAQYVNLLLIPSPGVTHVKSGRRRSVLASGETPVCRDDP
jgi:hypothetical protein